MSKLIYNSMFNNLNKKTSLYFQPEIEQTQSKLQVKGSDMASSTREWSVEKSSTDLRDLQATTMALSRADEGQVYSLNRYFR